MEILHSGYDTLKLTVDVDIPEEFLKALAEAKHVAAGQNNPEAINYCGIDIQVRKSGGSSAFSVSTGDYGAEWYFLDPHNKPKNNPGVQVDFRAFLLATGSIEAAKAHFEECMDAFGIRYTEHLIKVSRIDFAVDILDPYFIPDRRLVIAPPKTHTKERDGEQRLEHGIGEGVSGVTIGHISNRQLIIYDKRREIIESKKPGFIEIWNSRRAQDGKSPIDLKDRLNSQVWRFELRMGAKQLRNRWEIRSWEGLEEKIGDALDEFTQKIRYAQPNSDSNRSRWPTHPIWITVRREIGRFFMGKRNHADPTLVKTVNREAHKSMLDTLILGTMISRAVAEGIRPEEFEEFAHNYATLICSLSREHPLSVERRFIQSSQKINFR